MADRLDIVRHICTDWLGGLREHAADDFAIDGDGGIRLGLLKATLYPDLVVGVDELAELPGDRVMARLTIRSRDRPGAVRWSAAAIFQFRGDEVASAWSVADHLPWLTDIGALDMQALDRRFDEAIEARRPGDPPPPS